jgi:prepilin-type N-terminal cleavage/methylation domain-containing protein
MRLERKYNNRGFTLIEVMVAMGILAFSLVSLNTYQTYAVRSATESKKLTIATMLARRSLAETEIELRNNDFSEVKKTESGEFENFPGYTWTRTVEEFELTIPVPQTEDEAGEDLSMATFAQKLADIMSEHVMEVTLEVKYEVLGKMRSVFVVTHIADLIKDVNISL